MENAFGSISHMLCLGVNGTLREIAMENGILLSIYEKDSSQEGPYGNENL